MSKQTQAAGTSGGRIKRKEYLMYVLYVRQREEKMGIEENLCKSNEVIRAEYEQVYGYIYTNC